LKAKNCDFKAVNPNQKDKEDKRTPEELIAVIESQAKEMESAITRLKNAGL
jgi:hypothetical protein